MGVPNKTLPFFAPPGSFTKLENSWSLLGCARQRVAPQVVTVQPMRSKRRTGSAGVMPPIRMQSNEAMPSSLAGIGLCTPSFSVHSNKRPLGQSWR
jgi:hypothetical protein